MIIEWLFLILAVSGAGLIWCLPFVMWFIYYYDTKTNKLKEKNMKSEQIKHSLSVGTKSIQSRVFDRETDEVISFVKIPIKDSGLVRCEKGTREMNANELADRLDKISYDCTIEEWRASPVGEAATKLRQQQESIEGLNRDYDLLFAEYQLLLKNTGR